MLDHAILIAAHDSPGLGPLTSDRPSALLEVAGRPLIDHHLACLHRCGVASTCVVVGHWGALLREHLGSRAEVVDNPRHSTTGSLYSLWLARDRLRAGAVVLAGEALVPARLLERALVAEAPDALLVDRARPAHAPHAAVVLAGPFVAEVVSGLCADPSGVAGVGLLKLGPEGARRMIDILEQKIGEGAVASSMFDAIAELAHTWPVVAIDADGQPWAHVVSIETLAQANRVVAAARGGPSRDLRPGARR